MKAQFHLILIAIVGVAIAGCTSEATTQPEQKTIMEAVFASGHTVMEHEYQVTARAEGYLQQALVQEGDEVQQGAPLFRLSSEVQSQQLAQAQAQYNDAAAKLAPTAPQTQQLELQIEQARIQLAADEKNYRRYQGLVATKAVSALEFERVQLQYEMAKKNLAVLEQSLADLKGNLALQLKNAETQLAIQQENQQDYFLSSALGGQVLHVYKTQGELVRRGETVAQIGSGETLIRLHVTEDDISRVAVGQTALISLNTHNQEVYKARVTQILPAFNVQEQSFVVEAKFLEHPSQVLAGTQLQANIVMGQKEQALIIPTQYLLKGSQVMLANQELRTIETGLSNKVWTEVLSGLGPEDKLMLAPSL